MGGVREEIEESRDVQQRQGSRPGKKVDEPGTRIVGGLDSLDDRMQFHFASFSTKIIVLVDMGFVVFNKS